MGQHIISNRETKQYSIADRAEVKIPGKSCDISSALENCTERISLAVSTIESGKSEQYYSSDEALGMAEKINSILEIDLTCTGNRHNQYNHETFRHYEIAENDERKLVAVTHVIFTKEGKRIKMVQFMNSFLTDKNRIPKSDKDTGLIVVQMSDDEPTLYLFDNEKGNATRADFAASMYPHTDLKSYLRSNGLLLGGQSLRRHHNLFLDDLLVNGSGESTVFLKPDNILTKVPSLSQTV